MAEVTIFGESVARIMQAILNGFADGGLYALVALGIVVINKATGVFNFAHGWMMLIGAFIFWQFYANEPADRITFAMSGISALLIIGVIVSLGIGSATQDLVRPTPQFEGDQKKSRWREQLDRSRDRFSDFAYQNRMTIAIALGFLAWLAVGWALLVTDEPIIRGVVGAFIGCVIVGLLIERFTIRPLMGKPILTAILMTLAVGFILQGSIQILWGVEGKSINIFKEPDLITETFVPGLPEPIVSRTPGSTLPDYTMDTESWLGADLRVSRSKAWGFGISILTFALFYLLFQYTSIGLAMRATAEDQLLAESVGLRVRLILAIAWALVTVMAGVAGVIQGTAATVSTQTIPLIALFVFPAVLLGGIDSIPGAFVGGIALGLIEKLSIVFVSDTAAVDFMPYLVLLIVLLIRPEGLFGQQQIDRV